MSGKVFLLCAFALFLAYDISSSSVALAAPQNQQHEAQDIAAHHQSRVVLNCVVPDGHVFEGWQFNGQPVQYTNIISRGREAKTGERTEKLIIERFQYPTHAGQWACLQRTEARPYRQTKGLINLNLLRDGLENIDASATVIATPLAIVASCVAIIAAKFMAL